MIQYILLGLTIVAVGIWRWLQFNEENCGQTKTLIYFVLQVCWLTFLEFLLLVGISGIILTACDTPYYHNKSWDDRIQHLYALENKSGPRGNFFLGSGQINNEMTYFYLVKTKLGFQIKSVDADDCFLKMDATVATARLVPVSRGSKLLAWWGIVDPDFKYILHIPPNSIKRNFQVVI